MIAKLDISDGLRRQAFDYYARHAGVTLNAIAVFLGVNRHRFLSLRREWNWPPRSEAMAAARADPGASDRGSDRGPDTPPATTSLRDAAASLALATRVRLNALIADQAAISHIDHDRTARTLAAYAKTLTIAQSLLEQEETDLHEPGADEGAPRSLHELRDELAAHLERIVAEEEARGSDGLLV
jgi:hypothetical protein